MSLPFATRQMLIAAAFAASASATTITFSNTPAGQTPLYIGYNQGNYFPGSNTTAWAEYSGVNAFRVWASAGNYEPTSQTGLRSGAGIATLSDFETRKAAIRANPESTTYTDWATYNDRFENKTQSGNNRVKLNYALSHLTGKNISPILQMTRGPNDDYTAWSGKWDQWHFYYVMAYKAARDFGVARYQMFNEPDLPDIDDDGVSHPTIDPTEWQVRMKLASDAIRSAVVDVNSKFSKSLVPDLSGPTGIGGASTYANYGKSAIQTNRVDYAGRTVAYDILNTYDLHRYGTSPTAFTNDIDSVRSSMVTDSVNHVALPITYTEFNSRTTASYAGSTDTPDTPNMFTYVASNVLATVSRDAKALYAFKFNQTINASTGEQQKTGFFYTDNSAAPYDTTGASLGAETIRLLARALKGERPRFTGAVSGTALANYDFASSYDAASKNHYFVGVNRNSSGAAQDLTLNFSNWGIAPGAIVSVEEVSSGRHGEVVQRLTVPANGVLTLSQPLQSVWMLTVPQAAAAAAKTLLPTADAQVRNGTSAAGTIYHSTNFGADSYLRVGRSDADAVGDYASYLKFDIGNQPPNTIARAILQLSGQTLNASTPITFHVYALLDNSWTETGLKWDNAPDILAAADAKLDGVGDNAFPVGSLTYDSGVSTSAIDVTDFLRDHAITGTLSFVLIRELQYAADTEDGYVRLVSRDGVGTQPALFLEVVPEPAAIALFALPFALARRRR